MTPVQEGFVQIRDAIAATLAKGVNVFIGGDPTVIQVTLGRESYTMRLVKASASNGHPAAVVPVPRTVPDVHADLTDMSDKAKSLGYTGDLCGHCGSPRVKRAGTCDVCEDCGTTGGCG